MPALHSWIAQDLNNTMAKRRTEWIVIDSVKQEVRCNRCKESAPLTSVLGQRIEVFLGFCNSFIKEHKDCKEKK